METNDETSNANEHNMDKNPNWQEADQLAQFTNVAEELNWGLPRNNSVVRAGHEPATSGFKVRRPNHSATLPPLIVEYK